MPHLRWSPAGRMITATPLLALLALSGCDETFTPVEEGRTFSIFGYLDASADTQWIRVMPVRPLLLTQEGPLDLSVTLEREGGDGTIQLRDSLHHFLEVNPVGGEGLHLHNFWTTERILPGATYRFAITAEDGKRAEAIVPIPEEYELSIWISQGRTTDADVIALEGVAEVAFAIRDMNLRDQCGLFTHRVFESIPRSASRSHRIPVRAPAPHRTNCGTAEFLAQRFLIVASAAPWPVGAGFEADALGVPEIPSNITNSVGFLGGVLTRRIPYENCLIETTEPVDYCRLRYDDDAVTLQGTVRDVLCTGGPVEDADIILRELDWDPPGPKLRATRSDAAGRFEVQALEGGRRYQLTVRKLTRVPETTYFDHVDTLSFETGERRSIDGPLRRAHAC